MTTDNDLLGDGEVTRYTDPDEGQDTAAYSLDAFAGMIETSSFSLDEVPEILALRVGDRPPPRA